MTIKVKDKEVLTISIWELSEICGAIVAIANAIVNAKKNNGGN